jgi:hypothetical protein
MRHPDGPFTTLIAVATAYLHPETEYGGLEALQERAADDDAEMRIFKDELRQAIRDPGLLPDNELFRHAAAAALPSPARLRGTRPGQSPYVRLVTCANT